ncbi:hypothetical protein EIM44_04225 [Bibersteinia trehalosi]|uniref:Uncharacterized protein n=1 Tax=Bibersteinia trehalosi TaxID=47735 RepID=A0A3R8MFL0_BIBTR|nr:hypothetical protein [Bibersteinia trehalosi]RRN04654.1 hypothetical protein EIM44_04225 [Bibersteinia trehalosi]
MDKKHILKFLDDNTTQAINSNSQAGVPMQILHQGSGNIVFNYGSNAVTSVGCVVEGNANLTDNDKQEVRDLIKELEEKNKK